MSLKAPVQVLGVSLALVASAVTSFAAQLTAPSSKERLVLTHDPELDDVNTLIRALLYSTDFEIAGLVYASAGIHFKGDGKGTTQYIVGREYARMGFGPRTTWRWPEDDKFIDAVVDAYAQVYPNLKVHNPAYPEPAVLKSKVKWGNVEFEGDYSKDTDGSNLIKSLLLDEDPRQVFVTAGGGQSSIARALKSIYDQHAKTPDWERVRAKVSRKLVIIPWGDQDSTNARYIRPNWPDVQTWLLAMVNFGYSARTTHTPENQLYLSSDWTEENVSRRGPLGAMYRVWGDGKQMTKGDMTDYFGLSGLTADQLRERGYNVWTPPQEKGSFTSEGDTPTFLNFVANGLRGHEDNGFAGGWGGRRRTDTPAPNASIVPASPDDPGVALGLAPAGSNANAPAPVSPDATGARGGGRGGAPGAMLGGGGGRGGQSIAPRTASVNARFFAAAQNDFAARMKWSVTPRFADANHEPQVAIKGSLAVTARPGATVRLEGAVVDPDGDRVSVNWWQYHDAGTYPGDVALPEAASLATSFQVPADAQAGQTIHLIFEATDAGTPALTRYQRVVVTVQ